MNKKKPEKPQKLESQTPKNSGMSRKQSISSKKSVSRKRSAMALIEEHKKPEWEKLKTGLQLYINTETIKKWWESDKIKLTIIDHITKFFEQMQILKNFESMDISILSEFHIFNLIFAKEELYLDDQKTTILINLLWTLLISNNEDYEEMTQIQNDQQAQDIDFVNKSNQAEDDYFQNELEEKQRQQLNQSKQSEKQSQKSFHQQQQNKGQKKLPNLKRRKTRETDMAAFIFWLKKHSQNIGNSSQKYFEPSEVQKIVDYVKKSYFTNYNLYKFALINKKANEEIRYTLTIDEPLSIPPLSEALFMGQKKFIIDDEDDTKKEDDVASQHDPNLEASQDLKNSQVKEQQQVENEENENNQSNIKENDQIQNEIDMDPQTKLIRQLAEENLNVVQDQFSQTLNKKDEHLQEQLEEILNPKKKK